MAENDALKPSACFQKMCQVMMNEGLNKQQVEDFRLILHMLLLESSRHNIEAGKTWILEKCTSPNQVSALMEYLLSLSRSTTAREERLHLIYLLNDVLYHASRRKLFWIRDTIFPLLVPLLKLAYEAAETDEHRAKVTKCITFWSDRDIFDEASIAYMRQVIVQPALISQPAIPNVPNDSPSLPPKVQMVSPSKPYYELPAGLMTLHHVYYKPINPSTIKVPFPPPEPTKEVLDAIQEFYSGLDLLTKEVDPIFDDKVSQIIDPQGWQKGYLDNYYEKTIAQRKEWEEKQRQKEEEAERDRRRHSDHRTKRSRSRGRSPTYRSRSRDYHRSRSPSYSSYDSRGRSRSYTRRKRSRSRTRYRSRSPYRSLSRRHRHYSRSPPPSYHHRSPQQHHHKPVPTPVVPVVPTSSFNVPPPPPKHLGLGNQTMDEFAAFRRNKSESYSRREPPPPLICYKCGKPGHLARECDSL
ncbi:hypothetical protein RMCBS344292_12459 [Rhizopus microsporus]|nr:hypothetical protein RMCBS344292_12459 [Rhizopus microsporus]